MSNYNNRKYIQELALEKGFKLKPQSNGREDLNDYVYAFAEQVQRDVRAEANLAAYKKIQQYLRVITALGHALFVMAAIATVLGVWAISANMRAREWQEVAENPAPAEPLPLAVVIAEAQSNLDRQCSAWLFSSNIMDARDRICKRGAK